MMPFSFRQKKEKIVVIIDIGSSSVGSTIVSFRDDNNPKILFSARENMVFQRTLNMDRFISSMKSTLEKVLLGLKKSTNASPEHIVCVFASPWYKSVIKTFEIDEKEKFIVTQKLLDDLIQGEITKSNISIDKFIEEPISIIDIKNIQVKLNGYETDNPYDKEANVLRISFFAAFSFTKTLSIIRGSILKIFNPVNISFYAFPLIAFSVIRDIFSDKNNFLFLDITGEITDISFIKDGVFWGSESFPLGKNFVIRRLASGLNTSTEDAISVFNLVSSGKSNKEIQERVNKILSLSREEWSVAFSKSVINATNGNFVPTTIFFTADDEISKYFFETLSNGKFEMIMSENNTFDVRFLNAKTLENFCTFGNDINEEDNHINKDAFLIIESIFLHRSKQFYRK